MKNIMYAAVSFAAISIGLVALGVGGSHAGFHGNDGSHEHSEVADHTHYE